MEGKETIELKPGGLVTDYQVTEFHFSCTVITGLMDTSLEIVTVFKLG